MMALVLTLSLAACVENNTVSDSDITPSSSDSNTEESIDLVESRVTGFLSSCLLTSSMLKPMKTSVPCSSPMTKTP